MPATNKDKKRIEFDAYLTPPWCVDRVIEELRDELPMSGSWLEPCAGEGMIIRRLRELAPEIKWSAIEIRAECRDSLKPVVDRFLGIGDFLNDFPILPQYDMIITNPPYGQAEEVLRRCLELSPRVLFLLRQSFLASKTRCEFLRANPPDIFTLPDRPKFTTEGSDMAEYNWCYWGPHRKLGGYGRAKVLDVTPLPERQKWSKQMKGVMKR